MKPMPVSSPEKNREYQRRWYAKNKKKKLAQNAAWLRTPEGKASQRKYRSANADKNLAGVKLHQAGWRAKGLPCQVDGCNGPAVLLHHPEDSDDIWAVIPVCASCHGEQHRR